MLYQRYQGVGFGRVSQACQASACEPDEDVLSSCPISLYILAHPSYHFHLPMGKPGSSEARRMSWGGVPQNQYIQVLQDGDCAVALAICSRKKYFLWNLILDLG